MIVSFLNEKGGVGKTTLTCNFAAYFAKVLNKSVILVDTDVQGSLSDWHTMSNLRVPLLSLHTPKSIDTLAKLSKQADYIFVDGGGKTGLDGLSVEIIIHSDIVIIPLQPGNLDLWGTESIAMAAKSRQKLTGRPHVYTLFNRVNERTNIYNDSKVAIRELEIDAFSACINQRVSYAGLASRGLSVVDTPGSKTYFEIEHVCLELEQILAGEKNELTAIN